MTQTQRLTEIRRNLSVLFSDDETRTLMFDLGIDYDSLPAVGKEGKVRELLALVDRKGLVPQLISLCRRERPNAEWREIADTGLEESPFKGLEYFDIADAALFFGREQLTAKLIRRLGQECFLAVVGASGSGKSSLVRAGVAATLLTGGSLVDGARPPGGSNRWLVRIMTPTAQPIEALASQLVPASEPISNLDDFIHSARQHPNRLHLQAVRQLAQVSQATGRVRERMLLIVDQFEEVFTLCRDDAQR